MQKMGSVISYLSMSIIGSSSSSFIAVVVVVVVVIDFVPVMMFWDLRLGS